MHVFSQTDHNACLCIDEYFENKNILFLVQSALLHDTVSSDKQGITKSSNLLIDKFMNEANRELCKFLQQLHLQQMVQLLESRKNNRLQ